MGPNEIQAAVKAALIDMGLAKAAVSPIIEMVVMFGLAVATIWNAYVSSRVKHGFDVQMHKLKSTDDNILQALKDLNQLRLAVAERRMQAHQEAFFHWRRLIEHVHQKDKIGKTAYEAEQWWEKNCLYLDESARKAFRSATMSAASHHNLLEGGRDPELIKVINHSMDIIYGAGEAIQAAVNLPPLIAEAIDVRVKHDASA